MRKQSSLCPPHSNIQTQPENSLETPGSEAACVAGRAAVVASLISYSQWVARSWLWWRGGGSDSSCSGCWLAGEGTMGHHITSEREGSILP